MVPDKVPHADSTIECCTPENVATASDLVSKLYSGKKDRNGYPMLSHPYAVGMMGSTNDEVVVGFLHDVFRDTDIDQIELMKMFPIDIVTTISMMTRRSGEMYTDYISRIIKSQNTLAFQVKLNDLKYNLAVAEADKSFSLANRYRTAITMIENTNMLRP